MRSGENILVCLSGGGAAREGQSGRVKMGPEGEVLVCPVREVQGGIPERHIVLDASPQKVKNGKSIYYRRHARHIMQDVCIYLLINMHLNRQPLEWKKIPSFDDCGQLDQGMPGIGSRSSATRAAGNQGAGPFDSNPQSSRGHHC